MIARAVIFSLQLCNEGCHDFLKARELNSLFKDSVPNPMHPSTQVVNYSNLP